MPGQTRRALLIGVSVLLLVVGAAAPGAVTAKSAKGKGAKAAANVALAIALYNGAVRNMADFARQAKLSYQDCLTQQGEPQEAQDWSNVEAAGRAMQMQAHENLRPHIKRLKGFSETLEALKAKGKKQKQKKKKAIKWLRSAIDEHGKEAYQYDGAGLALTLHECSNANAAEHAAAAQGDPAWIDEYGALVAARELAHVKGKAGVVLVVIPWSDAGFPH